MAFRQQIETLAGHSTNLCFQCSKCSTGCPSVDKMDLKPAQVMHSIRLGREEAVLNSEAIWLCVGCETCSARCPQQVEPAAIMATARLLAMQKGIQPRVDIHIQATNRIENSRLKRFIFFIANLSKTSLFKNDIIINLYLTGLGFENLKLFN